MANQYVGQLSPPVRQAIFGNVASLIIFRLGLEDANTVSKELGVFTANDVLNLEVGQAIARIGGSSSAFNLRTFTSPARPDVDPTEEIIANTRQRYARPRAVVEAELNEVIAAAEKLELMTVAGYEASDPYEDDLVT